MVRLADAVRGIGSGEGIGAARARMPGTPPPATLFQGLLDYMVEVGRQTAKGERFDFERGLKIARLLAACPAASLKEMSLLPTDRTEEVSRAPGKAQERPADRSAGGNGAGPTDRPDGRDLSCDDSFALHGVRIAIKVVHLGGTLRYGQSELAFFAGAALFHDLGMYLLPESMRGKIGVYDERERGLLRRHPLLSRDLLCAYGGRGREMGEIIAQEHERFDGSGYPHGLGSTGIHGAAYLIGLADIHEALIRGRANRPPSPPAEALAALVRRTKGSFPQHLIKNVLRLFAICPEGSLVRLSDERIGVVVRNHPLWPLSPTVALTTVAEEGEEEEAGPVIDLARTPGLTIAEIF